MALAEGHKANFQTLLRAAAQGDLCLLDCNDKATGNPVAVVCAVSRQEDGGIELVPMAKLFDGNPYEELIPPMEDGDESS